MEGDLSRDEHIERTVRCIEWLKHQVVDAKIRQSELCDATGLHSSTVSRYFNLPSLYAKGHRGSRLLIPREEHLVGMMDYLSKKLDRDIRQEGMNILHRIETRGSYSPPPRQSDDLAILAHDAVTIAKRLKALPPDVRGPIQALCRAIMDAPDEGGEVVTTR